MKLLKENSVKMSGNVAHVDIKQGQHGPFGNVMIMVDDGYFKKGINNQSDTFVERSYPISIKVNSNVIGQAGPSGFQKGDFLAIEGKNIVEFGKGQNGEPDNSKKYPKVEAKTILQHIPVHIAKQLRADISAEKQQSNNQHQNNNQYQDTNQHPQNGSGYQEPQQNRGGYQQQRQQNQNYYNNGHDNGSNRNHQPQGQH